LIPDAVAVQELIPAAISLLENEAMRRDFSQKVATLGHPNAAARIVDVLERLVA
jgi:hypothetical protein